MSDAGDAGGFFDHDEEFVDVGDSDIGRFDGFRKRFVPEFDHVLVGYFSNWVQAQVSVDLDFASSNRFTDIAPTPVGESFFDCPFQDRSVVRLVQVDQLKGFGRIGFHGMDDW